MNNISQRDAFWNKVYELAKADERVVIVSADMGAPSLDRIRKEIPSQFINVGIAEQNAITLAAGLALSGKKVFAYAIAPFITIRCLEQIRVENAIMKIPITIVGIGAGFGYEDAGPTHHLIEDVAMLRSMPNIVINTMTDSVMASAFASISYSSQTTNYLRIFRQNLPDIYPANNDFTKGLAVLKESKDFYLIATGSMTHMALEVSNELKKRKIDAGVIDVFTVPINQKLFIERIKKVKKIITLEEHFLPGGLGSAVCEILNDNGIRIPVKRIGIPTDKGYCYKYGGIDVIRKYYEIDGDSVCKQVKDFIKQRQ